jgi:hypothetical protein
MSAFEKRVVNYIFLNFDFFLFKMNFYLFLNYFDRLILKNKKYIYFNIFLNK